MADPISTAAANTLTKEQYAARAGVDPSRVAGDFGNYSISPDTLGAVSPLPVVEPPPAVPLSANALPDYQTPELQPTAQESKISGLINTITSLNTQNTGRTAFRAEQEQSFGIPDINKTITDLTSQFNAIKKEAAAIPLQFESDAVGKPITTRLLGAQEAQALRTNTIKALQVATLLEAARGNLSTAQANVDRAVNLKYGPIEEEIAANMANLELLLNDPLTSLQDKNRAQKQLDAQNARVQALAGRKETEKEIWNIATTAASNGSGFKATSTYKTLSQALQAISQAATKEAALDIAVSTGLIGAEEAGLSGPASVQEYQFAVSQGYKGSFLDYQREKATQFGTEGTDGDGTIKLSSTNKTKLLGAGFTNEEILQIQKDINTYGINAVLEGVSDPAQKKAIQEVYGVGETGSKLTRTNLSNLFGIPDNDEKSGFLGFFGAGKTNKEKLDELVAAVEKYQAVGYSDDEILKLMK